MNLEDLMRGWGNWWENWSFLLRKVKRLWHCTFKQWIYSMYDLQKSFTKPWSPKPNPSLFSTLKTAAFVKWIRCCMHLHQYTSYTYHNVCIMRLFLALPAGTGPAQPKAPPTAPKPRRTVSDISLLTHKEEILLLLTWYVNNSDRALIIQLHFLIVGCRVRTWHVTLALCSKGEKVLQHTLCLLFFEQWYLDQRQLRKSRSCSLEEHLLWGRVTCSYHSTLQKKFMVMVVSVSHWFSWHVVPGMKRI